MFYKYIFSLLILSSSFTLFGQELPYTFQFVNVGEYQPLTNATTVDTNGPWDDPVLEIPIGFEVAMFGESFDTFYLNGYIGGFLMSSNTESSMLAPYGEDLTDRGYGTEQSMSPILYKVDGQAPGRIFKIEWQNAGFYNEVAFGSSESYVNFQLWIYETAGLIEYCYGPSNIASNDVFGNGSGPSIGLLQSANVQTFEIGNSWFLTGESTDPVISPSEANPVTFPSLNQTPPVGQIYAFYPTNVSAVESEELAVGVQIYPNPVVNQLTLELDLSATPDQLEARIFNTLGQQVYFQSLGQSTESLLTVDVEQLPKGSYIVQVRDGQAQISKRIIKQ